MLSRILFLSAKSMVGLAIAVMPVSAYAQTSLSAGDLVITGFNFDNADTFTFLLLKDVSASTEIHFTDNGVKTDGSLRTSEGTYTHTFSSAASAGTVVGISDFSGITGPPSFSASGDQVIAYQEVDAVVNYIYAVNSEGTGFQADATSSNTTALPTGLVVGSSAVAIDEVDNGVFDVFSYNINASSDLTPSGWRAAVGNQDNWTVSNTNRQITQSGTASVVPSPTAGFGALALLGLTAMRRRRTSLKDTKSFESARYAVSVTPRLD